MITIYTDGSCLGNPGPGGWAAVIDDNGAKRSLSGKEDNTTNNRMEILAAIEGLQAVPAGSAGHAVQRQPVRGQHHDQRLEEKRQPGPLGQT